METPHDRSKARPQLSVTSRSARLHRQIDGQGGWTPADQLRVIAAIFMSFISEHAIFLQQPIDYLDH